MNSINVQNPRTGEWVPATPLGWQEEHGPLARFLFWLCGVGHCGKSGWRK